MKKIYSLVTGILCLVTGCSGVSSAVKYKDETPKMDIRQYLNGNLEAWGLFEDFKGKIAKRFEAKLVGSWHGDSGTLKEHFTYSDGKTQNREWKITMQDDNHFTATAADVIGEAKGEQYGNAAHLQYVLEIDSDGKKIAVSMDDWLYLVNGQVVINKARMSKFGVQVGELTVSFYKPTESTHKRK